MVSFSLSPMPATLHNIGDKTLHPPHQRDPKPALGPPLPVSAQENRVQEAVRTHGRAGSSAHTTAPALGSLDPPDHKTEARRAAESPPPTAAAPSGPGLPHPHLHTPKARGGFRTRGEPEDMSIRDTWGHTQNIRAQAPRARSTVRPSDRSPEATERPLLWATCKTSALARVKPPKPDMT